VPGPLGFSFSSSSPFHLFNPFCSDNFAKLYYIVFLALAIKFGFMYHKSGMLVASSGFMKLGHATLERVNSFKEQAQALKKSTADERKKTD